MGRIDYAKLLRGSIRRIRRFLYNPYKVVGWSPPEVLRLRYHTKPGLKKCTLFSHPFYYNEAHELFHAVNEIFLDQVYKCRLSEHAVIWDCGSHFGMSIVYFKQQYPGCVIKAFEPDERNFELLQKNIGPYHDQVELKNEAVWVQDTELYFSNEGSMSSRLDPEGTTAHPSKVKAVRLKSLMNSKIDLLKIDIEGAEYKVLKDIQDSLHWVANLFIEYHGRFNQNMELNEILSILVSCGFHYYLKEASSNYDTPLFRDDRKRNFDIQLNVFCFRPSSVLGSPTI